MTTDPAPLSSRSVEELRTSMIAERNAAHRAAVLDELCRRAAANERLREAAEALVSECDGLYIATVTHGAGAAPIKMGPSRQCLRDVEVARKKLKEALAAAPPAEPKRDFVAEEAAKEPARGVPVLTGEQVSTFDAALREIVAGLKPLDEKVEILLAHVRKTVEAAGDRMMQAVAQAARNMMQPPPAPSDAEREKRIASAAGKVRAARAMLGEAVELHAGFPNGLSSYHICVLNVLEDCAAAIEAPKSAEPEKPASLVNAEQSFAEELDRAAAQNDKDREE